MGLHSLLFKTTFGLHRSNSPFYTAFILPCNLGVIRGTSKVEKKHTKNCPFRKYPYICTAIERCFMYFLIRRDGRVVDYSGLENRRTERYRGFESLSLRWKVWTKTDNKRTKAYKSMICRLFCLYFVQHKRHQKDLKRHKFVPKSLPIPYRTKTVTICPKMTSRCPNLYSLYISHN